MEDPRISQQQVAQPLSGTEALPIVQTSIYSGKPRTLRTDINALKDFLVKDFTNALYPAGAIMPYASNAVDDTMGNWLLCDGRSVAVSAYPGLYSSIGKTYGSVDENSFNLPNLQGRVIMGYCDVKTNQTFNYGKWNASNTVNVGSVGGKYNTKIQKSFLPISYVTIPTLTKTSQTTTYTYNLVQDVDVSVAVDGSDFLVFQGNSLSVQHRNWQELRELSVIERTLVRETGSIISNTNKVTYGASGGSLPFNIIQTTNVELINVSGRSAITLHQVPQPSNSYTTIVLVDDDGPAGRTWQSFTLRFTSIVTENITTNYPFITQNVVVDDTSKTSTTINNIQPYMALNYIIKY
jgi:microcystin-dependent protein